MFGSSAYVICSGGSSSPRVTHVEITFEGANIKTKLGKSACREIAQNNHVTVLWPTTNTTSSNNYLESKSLCLIVDGCVEGRAPEGGGEIFIATKSAILHQERGL